MTIENKISKALISIGLVGLLGGWTDAITTIFRACQITRPLAVQRMSDIDNKLLQMSGFEIYQYPHYNKLYHDLIAEYIVLQNNLQVRQEKKEYLTAQNKLSSRFEFSIIVGALALFPLIIGVGFWKNMPKQNAVDPFAQNANSIEIYRYKQIIEEHAQEMRYMLEQGKDIHYSRTTEWLVNAIKRAADDYWRARKERIVH